jgi:hypothetical protein
MALYEVNAKRGETHLANPKQLYRNVFWFDNAKTFGLCS